MVAVVTVDSKIWHQSSLGHFLVKKDMFNAEKRVVLVVEKEKKLLVFLPTEHTKNQIEHEEWTNHNEGHKVDEIERSTQGIVGLQKI